MQVNAIKYKKLWFSFSGFLVLAGIFFVSQSFIQLKTPLRLGLDFTGGSKLEYKFVEQKEAINSETVLALLDQIGLHNSNATTSKDGEPTLILRTRAISDDPMLETLNNKLKETYGNFQLLSIDTVSPVIGPELLRTGLVALIATVWGIIFYISNRFQKDYALCAIAALFHDVFIVIGLFAFLGLHYNIEVDSLFITALLTIFGFSVHDTIVVFDRIRENQKLQSKNLSFAQVTELSINQVVIRSLYTSLTILMTLALLIFFGGTSTRLFVAAMFAGLLIGTYSSIFIASPLLVIMRSKAT
jgi:preprotein translocase subunit SecF